MHPARRAQYCRHCRCHTIYRWVEPSHHAYSALTLVLIGTAYVTPVSAALLLALWVQRIASTRRWACPHCSAPEAIAAGGAVAA